MQYVNRKNTVVFAVVVLGLALAGGCSPDMAIEVGPFEVSVSAGEGSFAPSEFLQKVDLNLTATREQAFCQIPTEEEAAAGVQMVGNINVGDFVQLSRLELFQIVVVATEGDFSFAHEVVIRYIPVQVGEEEPIPVILGTAQAEAGFGSTIVLTPPEDVDFLELIRANDATGLEECPTIEVELTAHAVPLEEVHYTAEAQLDAYAEVGLF
jgi:hypothetical protein